MIRSLVAALPSWETIGFGALLFFFALECVAVIALLIWHALESMLED